jgi:RNA polymerase sigma-70 factor (ECF subfamily)
MNDGPPTWHELAAAVRRYVRRRVRDDDVAADLAKDVFVKLALHLRRGSIRGPLHAWLLRAARTTVIDHLRARARSTPLPDDLAATADSPATAAAAAPLLAACRAFLGELPPAQREALLRTDYDGRSQQSVAADLGVAVSTVKSRVQRGRRRLERALRACCEFEFDRRGNVVDWQRRPGGGCGEC